MITQSSKPDNATVPVPSHRCCQIVAALVKSVSSSAVPGCSSFPPPLHARHMLSTPTAAAAQSAVSERSATVAQRQSVHQQYTAETWHRRSASPSHLLIADSRTAVTVPPNSAVQTKHTQISFLCEQLSQLHLMQLANCVSSKKPEHLLHTGTKLENCTVILTYKPMPALTHPNPNYNPNTDLDLLTSESMHAEGTQCTICLATLVLIVQAVFLLQHKQTHMHRPQITYKYSRYLTGQSYNSTG